MKTPEPHPGYEVPTHSGAYVSFGRPYYDEDSIEVVTVTLDGEFTRAEVAAVLAEFDRLLTARAVGDKPE